jgi:hypothetical protein
VDRVSAVDDRPARISAGLAVLAGVGTVGLVAPGSPTAAAVAVGGLALVVAGLAGRSVAGVTGGSFGLFVGVLLAGNADAGAVLLVGAALGAVLAWDFGEQAITVGRQVGREATTTRGELTHAAASLLVGLATVAVLVGTFRAATGGFHVGALLVLLAAAVVLVSALQP